VNPPRVIPHRTPSHWGASAFRNNFNAARGQFAYFRGKFPNSVGHIAGYRNHFLTHGLPLARARWNNYSGYFGNSSYRYYHHNWYSHGFYGGYWYPVRPCWTMNNYYYYPLVQWLYVQQPDVTYYQNWYGADYTQYPVAPNPYVDVFFPTDTWRDALVELSGLSADLQYNFRQSLLVFTGQLKAQVGAVLNASFEFQQYEVVVNHYENLGNRGVVLEGFVDRNDANIHLPFKALLDLEDPQGTLTFVPSSENPSVEELQALDDLNARIKAIGGDPYSANEEPQQAPAEPPLEGGQDLLMTDEEVVLSIDEELGLTSTALESEAAVTDERI
jgi:hypothetical protein